MNSNAFVATHQSFYINSRGMVEVPCLISSCACGTDAPFNDGYTMEEVPPDIFAKTDIPILINAMGDSMAPLFEHGDKLLIETAEGYKDRDIVCCALNGDMIVKRIRMHRDGVYLDSYNPRYLPRKVAESDTLNVIGVVKYCFKKVNPIDFDW